MKQKQRILAAACSLCLVLAACSATDRAPEDDPVAISAVTLEEYRGQVETFRTTLMEEAILLSNAGKYEYNYLKAQQSVGGNTAAESIAKSAMEWLAKQVEGESQDTLQAGYDDLSVAYGELVSVVPDDAPEELRQAVNDLYTAYVNLYQLVAAPSGGLNSFASHYNDYSDTIKEKDAIIQALTQ